MNNINNSIIKWLFENDIQDFEIVEMDKNRYQLKVDKEHWQPVLLFLSEAHVNITSVETVDNDKLFLATEPPKAEFYVEYEPSPVFGMIYDGGIK